MRVFQIFNSNVTDGPNKSIWLQVMLLLLMLPLREVEISHTFVQVMDT